MTSRAVATLEGRARRSSARAAAASLAVGLAAFWLYTATLLPGLDFGDTASFQAVAGTADVTARDAYPLYFAIGGLFVRLAPANPAGALNLVSAVFAALACAVLTRVVAVASASAGAGAFAGLLLASSYTFWSQAIIAEVYTLHLFLASACLAAMLAWAARPATWRLAAFFALYALAFGNHLSMILLAPAFTLFILGAAPGGPGTVLRPRILLLAAGLAALGAVQYLPAFSTVLHSPTQPTLSDAAATFWFDVTKADWRASLVLGAPTSTVRSRFAMYRWDLAQQFGVAGVVLALAGLVYLWRVRRVLAVSMAAAFLVNWVFAFTYNVGDAHVFYLPSHFVVALLAGFGVAAAAAAVQRAGLERAALVVPVLFLLYPAWRAYDTYPALDRSDDHRAEQFCARFTGGVTGENGVVGMQLNWQLQNALAYYTRRVRPEIVTFDLSSALLRAPFLVTDNEAIGRRTLVAPVGARAIETSYATLFAVARDDAVPTPGLADEVGGLPAGTRYVLAVLQPYPDVPLDAGDLGRGVARLTAGASAGGFDRHFNVLAGRVGLAPEFRASADRPFRRTVDLGGLRLDIRMESWLPTDTIRRAWFGHVVAGRRHVLALDRGVSFVAFDERGGVSRTGYASALLAPLARYDVRKARAAGVLSYGQRWMSR